MVSQLIRSCTISVCLILATNAAAKPLRKIHKHSNKNLLRLTAWARGPLYARMIKDILVSDSEMVQSGVTPEILLALAKAKSDLKPDYQSSTAYGLTGISPVTAGALHYAESDLLNPRVNLTLGAISTAVGIGASLSQFIAGSRKNSTSRGNN